jgi:glutamyl-tRNA reductase
LTKTCQRPRFRIGLSQSKQSVGRGAMAKVAFLGLGVMGYPMAGHLAKKGGHDVTVYNRTAAKAAEWTKT